jgi:hypothetical protein
VTFAFLILRIRAAQRACFGFRRGNTLGYPHNGRHGCIESRAGCEAQSCRSLRCDCAGTRLKSIYFKILWSGYLRIWTAWATSQDISNLSGRVFLIPPCESVMKSLGSLLYLETPHAKHGIPFQALLVRSYELLWRLLVFRHDAWLDLRFILREGHI